MMRHARRIDRRALLRLAVGAGCAPRLAAAQTVAQRALRWIVPFPAGGTTDVVTRVVAAEMAARLGQPVVVDNRPGAGTVIGVDAAAKAAADGSTLVSVANSFCVNQTLVRRLPYDGLRDLRPIGLMGRSDHVLVTHPGSGLRTVADLRAALRRGGAPLSYASFGNGTSAHLAGAMLQVRLGAPLIHVPYKGQAPALADLLGAQVTMMFGNWPELRQHIASGRLVALGVATAQRTLEAPAIATLAEQGVPIESNSWSGAMTRAGVSDAAVARLSTALRQALGAPPVRRMFAEESITSLEGTPEQFGAFLRSEVDKYAQVIGQAGITDEG
jgi:tripartite-type tricarboxylate transporter receptor subunit TctC